MYIILITLLGLALRCINIIKPEGLWNDEYVSWLIASTPFNGGFWQEILQQCHMPLYYLYLKPFTNYTDLILRLTSVVPGILAIIAMYFVGKEFSKKRAFICAITTSILPFLIYYSQEVRFYSLLFLFSSLSLLYTIRLIKGQNCWRGYTITTLLILLTHVLGGIYIALTLGYIIYKRKLLSKKLLLSIVLGYLFVIPFGLNIIKMIPSSQWWGHFSYTNILFLFSDYLSPILTNNINAPTTFLYNNNPLFLILITIPTIISIGFIIEGAKKSKGLALIALGTIFITAILAITGKIVFITKYTIEILPILLLLLALGVNKRLSLVFFTILITFHIFAIFTPYYPAKTYRSEGHKLVSDILNKENSDAIVFTYYEPDRFYRYLDNKSKNKFISKINRFEYMEKPDSILNDIKTGERVSIVFLDSVSFIPPNWIETARIKNLPEMFITFSIIRNKLINELNENYKNYNVVKKGSWTVITATKLR